MTERLLQFIWQFQYFNQTALSTYAGEPISIIKQGIFNTNQGPDFSEARIKIGNTEWAGNVELHLTDEDWNKHEHSSDRNYDNVILHVVWKHQESTDLSIPVLELNSRVPKILLDRYENLMNANSFIPCENSIHEVNSLIWQAWKERLVAERLIRKSGLIVSYLEQSNYHWEEIFWWLLARNFGIKVNAEAFELMARTIPVSLLSKHKNQIHHIEALLFGQAGLLSCRFTDDYPKMLQKEYRFYKKKYGLVPGPGGVFFLRMRPHSFPTVRLAQLAMLVCHSDHLFSRIKEANSIQDVRNWLNVTANDYWHYHYRFDEASPLVKKNLGTDMIDNIIINTIIPVLFTYGDHQGEPRVKLKALSWMETVSAENNAITKGFKKIGIEHKTAYDSQALIELKTQYCDAKRCLQCAIGNALLRNL